VTSQPTSEEQSKGEGQGRRPGRLGLPVETPLRDGLIAAFDDILGYARRWALDAPGDPVTAVHEYRKSIRRARAMLRLLRSLMTGERYDTLATTLRDLHRATSAQRDRDVLLNTVNKLGLADAVPGLVARLQALESDGSGSAAASAGDGEERTIELLREGAARLQGLPEELDVALPAEVTWQDLARGIRQTYRRARRDMNATIESKREGRSGDDECLHDWRKRNKELAYQVELLISTIDYPHGARVRKSLSRLSRNLGEIVDILVLAAVADRLADDSERALAARATARARKKQVRRALKRGARLMHDRPRSFVRELVGGVRQARRGG